MIAEIDLIQSGFLCLYDLDYFRFGLSVLCVGNKYTFTLHSCMVQSKLLSHALTGYYALLIDSL